MPSALTGQSPSVPKDSATVGIRGSKKTDSGNEENGNEEDLDNDNTSPKVQDSIQRGEVQPQSISSVTVTKKYNWTVAKLYQITKDEEGNEWFCTLGREQSKLQRSLKSLLTPHYPQADALLAQKPCIILIFETNLHATPKSLLHTADLVRPYTSALIPSLTFTRIHL